MVLRDSGTKKIGLKRKENGVMRREKKNSGESNSAVDPGYLMLAIYVLGVTFLVLLAWFAGNNAAREGNHQRKDNITTQLLLQDKPAVADHFMTDNR